jgi:hypothetical protein
MSSCNDTTSGFDIGLGPAFDDLNERIEKAHKEIKKAIACYQSQPDKYVVEVPLERLRIQDLFSECFFGSLQCRLNRNIRGIVGLDPNAVILTTQCLNQAAVQNSDCQLNLNWDAIACDPNYLPNRSSSTPENCISEELSEDEKASLLIRFAFFIFNIPLPANHSAFTMGPYLLEEGGQVFICNLRILSPTINGQILWIEGGGGSESLSCENFFNDNPDASHADLENYLRNYCD